MNKKAIISIGTLLLLTSLAVFYFAFWNTNRIYIETENDAVKSKIKIEHGISASTINRKNDFELLENRKNYQVIYDKMFYRKISNEYGENDFLISYNDAYYVGFRQFKTNWRNQHSYKFKIKLESKTPVLEVEINGPNELSFTRKMIPFSVAYKHLYNELAENYYEDSKECYDNLDKFKSDKKFVTRDNKLFLSTIDSSIHLLTCDFDGHMYLRQLKTEIDLETAVQKGEFWTDKKSVFGQFHTSDGNLLYKISEADVETFRPYGNTIYGRDKNHVFDMRHGKVENVDVASFRPILLDEETGSSAFGRDKFNYFFWDEIEEDTIEFKKQMNFQN